ncbi:hypothetical protein SAMN05421640_1401 [Ekhidna lutea]|uniref:CAAX prenyl protease 2/Lysostaphin resistance protein A-like domain-containing protein n=1 Tax=Ekhidna lutea TaxID=447679 RepID=A0A239HNY8_EKHLU|nr:CPBP family intramembrane glutamic endopeptidase [Ekhidna lutea]SNS82623.1 hypothetical protein SAMN05421640_1401 [Ekhidna lutea]
MLGIIIQLVISWALLYWLESKNLNALGLLPTKQRLIQFVSGFLISSLMCVVYFQIQTTVTSTEWRLNPTYGLMEGLGSTWYMVKSVLFEELIFRGILLFILIKRIGVQKSCLISAVSFGIYHWFSYGIIGSPIQMIFVFLLTGTWGFMFAHAFAKTGSLYLPIALHLGWNLVQLVVFSQGGFGDQLLISSGGVEAKGLVSLGVFSIQWLGVPLILFFYLKHLGNKLKVPVENNKR